LVYVAAWDLGSWLQARRFERDCNAIIAWVRSGHSATGVYKGLKLPPNLSSLAWDGLADAKILGDGNVLVAFQTEMPWISARQGVLFSSAPLRPSEVGLDRPNPWFVSTWGYPELRIDGLWDDACIFKTVNAHEYIIGNSN
jgi:hypothetical protein